MGVLDILGYLGVFFNDVFDKWEWHVEISFSRLMLLVWIAFLTPAMMTIRGSTCHTCALIVSINGLYVFFLFVYFVQCVYHG